MLTAIIPDPDYVSGNKRYEAHGHNADELVNSVREFIVQAGYGASDTGSKFNVYRDGRKVGFVAYNGKVQISA